MVDLLFPAQAYCWIEVVFVYLPFNTELKSPKIYWILGAGDH
jgi:hypothetical protein